MENTGGMDLRKASQERQRLKDEYEALILKAGRNQRQDSWRLLEKPTHRLMCAAPMAILQLCHVIIDVMQRSTAKRQGWNPREGSDALKVVEDFALRLWDSPWKHELRTIKQYSGFYKGNITSKVECGEKLFEQMGYRACSGNELRLKKVSEDIIKSSAFELFLGRVLFTYLAEIHDRVKHKGLSVQQAWGARAKCTGTPEQVSRWMLTNVDSPKRQVKDFSSVIKPVVPKRTSTLESSEYFTNITTTSNKLGGYSSESNQNAAPEKIEMVKLDKRNKMLKDSGYLSATTSKDLLQDEVRPEGPTENRLEPRGVDLPVHKEVKNLHALYRPATQDEHVEMSLKALQQQQHGSGTTGPGWPSDITKRDQSLLHDWSFMETIPSTTKVKEPSPGNVDADNGFNYVGYMDTAPQRPAPASYSQVLPSALQFDSHHYATDGPSDHSPPGVFPTAVGEQQYRRCLPYGEPLKLHVERGHHGLIAVDGPDEVDSGALPPPHGGIVFSTFGKTSPQHTPPDSGLPDVEPTNLQDENDYVPAWPQVEGEEIYGMDESFPPPPPDLVNDDGEDSVSALLKDTQHHIEETLDKRIEHLDRRKAFSPESEAMLSRTQCHSLIEGDQHHDGYPSTFKSLQHEKGVPYGYPTKNTQAKQAHFSPGNSFETESSNRDQVDSNGTEGFWQCESCTYRNKPTDDICDMCNKSRTPGSEKDVLRSGDIQCGHCTLINPAKATCCAACHRSLKRSATYI